MKIVVQNLKSGELNLADCAAPVVNADSILVKTSASLISSGTERAVMETAQKTYLGKALERPDLVRKLLQKVKTDGLRATYQVVKNRINEPLPLGYSLAGRVIAVGSQVQEVKVGDLVACAGVGYANHAEIVCIPKNLCVKIPENVELEQAAYVALGAIAMHGLRQAQQQLGAVVLVFGLGLVGQISAQLCVAAGYQVIGVDLDPRKLILAQQLGVKMAFTPADPNLAAAVAQLSGGYGVDAVLLTMSSKNDGSVFETAAQYCRDRAKIVVVGDVKMDISRRSYFAKELEILQSRSYGPGRYDPRYEEQGQDYPIGYVRWTERRNMSAFLELIADKKINLAPLTTHRFAIQQATAAYEKIVSPGDDLVIGIVLQYPEAVAAALPTSSALIKPAATKQQAGRINLGLIGCGNFAKGILLPNLMATQQFKLRGVASARGLSAKNLQAIYQAEYVANDPLELINDPEISAVVIATRHNSHAKYVIAALQQHKHVLVEKPLCLNEGELAAIEAALETSRGSIMVGFNRRFSPLIEQLCQHFHQRQEPLSILYRINAGRIPTDGEAAWVHGPAGGGRIMGEVCHFVDLIQKITQERPVAVTSFSLNPQRQNLVANDIVTLTIEFSGGSLGTIHYWSNGDKSCPKEYLEVFGQEKIAILNNFQSLELIAGNKTQRIKKSKLEKGYFEEAQAFAHACRTGEQLIPWQSLVDTTLVTLRAGEDLQVAKDVELQLESLTPELA